jgi:hypothetical protein
MDISKVVSCGALAQGVPIAHQIESGRDLLEVVSSILKLTSPLPKIRLQTRYSHLLGYLAQLLGVFAKASGPVPQQFVVHGMLHEL